MKRKKTLTREEIIDQWIHLYPIRKLEYETDEKGLAVIIVPHPENWLTRKLLPKPKSPAGRIHLDEIGTFVWEKCDGSHTVQEICEAMVAEFGDKVEPVKERAVLFLQQLYKQEFIQMYGKKEGENEPPDYTRK